MIKIANLQLGNAPRIALSVSDRDTPGEIAKYKVDALELRVDSFKTLTVGRIVSKIRDFRKTRLPLILTVRSKEEGGKRHIPDGKRLFLFSSLIELVDAVDIELGSAILKDVLKIAKANRKASIISVHDLKRTPSCAELERIFKKAKSLKGDIFKIAVTAASYEDVSRLALFTLTHKKDNIISISMGSKGAVSRIFFPICGSLLTYSYINQPKAKGQIPISELNRQFKLYFSNDA